MSEPRIVNIIPCSGIGKSYGTVSREAAYQVTEDDRPGCTRLVPLSLLVLGDEEARVALNANPTITIDGCKLACATKMTEECGGNVAQAFAVLDVFRRYRDLKPQGVAVLNESGEKLADALAKEIDRVIDELNGEGEQHA